MFPSSIEAELDATATKNPGEGYTGADLLVDALEEYGVTRVFGNPGTTELPLLRSLSDSEIEYVLALHEDIAVGMAAGYACAKRYRSHDDPSVIPVGVVNLHLVAGVAHGLGNLYNAKIAGAPLVVTAGNHSQAALHDETVLGGDLVGLADQFAKWSVEVRHVEALPSLLRRAFRIALTPPTGPVFLSLPLDVVMAETRATPERLGAIPNAGRGDPAAVRAAVDLLVAAEDPLLVVGDGVARCGAVEAAVDLAEASGARVHGEILASEVAFPTDHDQWISHLPLMDESRAHELLSTDTLVVVGCSTNATFIRRSGDLVSAETTCVHVSDDPPQIGKNQPVDAAVIGDVGLVTSELAARLRERLPSDERERRLARTAELKSETGRASEEPAGANDGPGIWTEDLVETLRQVSGDAFVVDETLTSKGVLLARWSLDPGQYISNKGLGLGYGLPGTVGVAIAESESPSGRDVVGFIGDGSSLYYPHALYTASRYDLNLAVVVVNNGSYRVLKENYANMFDVPEADVDLSSLEFQPPVNIPLTGKGYGVAARSLYTAAGVEDALRSAVETPGPVVLDVHVRDGAPDRAEGTET
jgi:benzoylformate decarboxylase